MGVIVFGVLASGLWHRAALNNGIVMPPCAGLLYSYGVGGLIVPLVWLIFALLVHRSSSLSDGVKMLMFWLGIMVVVGLAAFVIYADVVPVFHNFWPIRNEDDLPPE